MADATRTESSRGAQASNHVKTKIWNADDSDQETVGKWPVSSVAGAGGHSAMEMTIDK